MLSDISTFPNDSNYLLSSFADDARLSILLKDKNGLDDFQDEIKKIYKWIQDSRLVFNSAKFQVIIFASKTLMTGEPIEVRDDDIKEVQIHDTVQDLGLLIDNDLTFSQELNKTIRKANKHHHWILRYFITRDPKVLIPVFKAIVLSVMDFPSLSIVSQSAANLARLKIFSKVLPLNYME